MDPRGKAVFFLSLVVIGKLCRLQWTVPNSRQHRQPFLNSVDHRTKGRNLKGFVARVGLDWSEEMEKGGGQKEPKCVIGVYEMVNTFNKNYNRVGRN